MSQNVGKPAPSGGLRHLLNAARYSILGLAAAWRNEQAFRQEAAALVILAPLALWLGNGCFQKGLLLASWLFVMAVELLNSAVEAAVDRIGSERHELSGRAKDLGSAAVFAALAMAAAVWGGALFDRFF